MTSDLGYYSLVRFCPDTSRGEVRNVAIVLVDPTRERGLVRAAPVSRVAPRARQAGLLDALLRSLAQRVGSGDVAGEAGLTALASASTPTLAITIPKPVEIQDPKATLASLYQSFVGVRSAREPNRKGDIVDVLVARLVRDGAPLERNAYVGDFAVDVLVTGNRSAAIQVLSFSVAESRGLAIEREAGHYLFGLEHTKLEGTAIVQPPTTDEIGRLWQSHDRVQRWLEDAGVRSVRPGDIPRLSAQYGAGIQLPLAYG